MYTPRGDGEHLFFHFSHGPPEAWAERGLGYRLWSWGRGESREKTKKISINRPFAASALVLLPPTPSRVHLPGLVALHPCPLGPAKAGSQMRLSAPLCPRGPGGHPQRHPREAPPCSTGRAGRRVCGQAPPLRGLALPGRSGPEGSGTSAQTGRGRLSWSELGREGADVKFWAFWTHQK